VEAGAERCFNCAVAYPTSELLAGYVVAGLALITLWFLQ